jgi:hypothetical protein
LSHGSHDFWTQSTWLSSPSMVIKTDSLALSRSVSRLRQAMVGGSLVPPTAVTSFPRKAGDTLLGAHENTEFSRVRLSWSANSGHPLVLEHIALYAR